VPISAEKLSSRIRDYKKYLKYLLESGIFVTNGSYVVGERCKGFKYSERYADNRPIDIIIENPIPYTTAKQLSQQKRHE